MTVVVVTISAVQVVVAAVFILVMVGVGVSMVFAMVVVITFIFAFIFLVDPNHRCCLGASSSASILIGGRGQLSPRLHFIFVGIIVAVFVAVVCMGMVVDLVVVVWWR